MEKPIAQALSQANGKAGLKPAFTKTITNDIIPAIKNAVISDANTRNFTLILIPQERNFTNVLV